MKRQRHPASTTARPCPSEPRPAACLHARLTDAAFVILPPPYFCDLSHDFRFYTTPGFENAQPSYCHHNCRLTKASGRNLCYLCSYADERFSILPITSREIKAPLISLLSVCLFSIDTIPLVQIEIHKLILGKPLLLGHARRGKIPISEALQN